MNSYLKDAESIRKAAIEISALTEFNLPLSIMIEELFYRVKNQHSKIEHLRKKLDEKEIK